MMEGRPLSGSLKHLSPPALLRLVSVTGASGRLELVTDVGDIQIDIVDGGVRMATERNLEVVAQILESRDGSYRFSPETCPPGESDVILDAADFLEAVRAVRRSQKSGFSSEVDVESLLAGEVFDLSGGGRKPAIHHLPDQAVENPLDDLLQELEDSAPGELLLDQVGVVSVDPRPWRGGLESQWRRRGWQLRLFPGPDEVDLDDLDLLCVHEHHSLARVGRERAWVELVGRAHAAGKPVIWIGPPGDPIWVARLIEAGTDFLFPAPRDFGGGTGRRLVVALESVVERWLAGGHRPVRDVEMPRGVTDLVDTLLQGFEAEEALGSFLNLAATQLTRGAVFSIEETAVRCRAGFGYPLAPGEGILPRGVGMVERMIRDGAGVIGIDPAAGGAVRVAQAVGLETFPSATVVLPLGNPGNIRGFLVGDRAGESLPDVGDLAMVARRLGGAFF